MGPRITKRHGRDISATAVDQAVSFLYPILALPLFLHFLGPAGCSDWLLLSALPTYISLGSLGIGLVTANAVALQTVAGEHQEARQSLHSGWLAQAILTAALVTTIFAACRLYRLDDALGLATVNEAEAEGAVIWLSLLSLSELLRQFAFGPLRSVGRYATGLLAGSFSRLCSLVGITIYLTSGGATLDGLAAAGAIPKLTVDTITLAVANRVHPELRFGFRYARVETMVFLISRGVSLFGFDAGRAVTQQGGLFLANALLGSNAVVGLQALQTIANAGLRAAAFFGRSALSELSRGLATATPSERSTLYRSTTWLSVSAASTAMVGLSAFGPFLVDRWTLGEVDPSPSLVISFALPILLHSGWATASSVLIAANAHAAMSARFLIVSLFAFAFTAVLAASTAAGLFAFAAGSLLREAAMLRPTTKAAVNRMECTSLQRPDSQVRS